MGRTVSMYNLNEHNIMLHILCFNDYICIEISIVTSVVRLKIKIQWLLCLLNVFEFDEEVETLLIKIDVTSDLIEHLNQNVTN